MYDLVLLSCMKKCLWSIQSSRGMQKRRMSENQWQKGKFLRKRRYSCRSVSVFQGKATLQSSALSEHDNAFSITAFWHWWCKFCAMYGEVGKLILNVNPGGWVWFCLLWAEPFYKTGCRFGAGILQMLSL